MKLKYFFTILIAIFALTTSCDDEETVSMLDEIQVSLSYVSIPADGGSTSITVTAVESWTLENDAEWLIASDTLGNAGETQLTFSADSTLDGRSTEILLHCAGQTQRINVIQGLSETSLATCAEVIDGPDSKTYRVTGVCTSIANTTYGNWYLEDETGSIYIYGTLDASGGEQNFLSLGLEIGDEVTIEGPKTTYGSVIELVNVTVLEINKSLVTVDSVDQAQLPLEGGEFTSYLTCKGEGLSVSIPEDAKSWLSISSIQTTGTSSVVIFSADANDGGDRETTITFSTISGTTEYTSQTSLSQAGAILEVSISEFLEAEAGETQYRLSGVITSIDNETYGNLYLQDFSGNTFVYGIDDFEEKELKEGDIITIVGKRSEYNGTPQVGGAILESAITVTTATIAEVLAKPDDSDTYFMVTGEISSIANDTYGNLYLTDGGNEIYLYGCYPGYGASDDDKKNLIEIQGLKAGDTLTVIATKGSYNDVSQLSNSIYYSHVSAE